MHIKNKLIPAILLFLAAFVCYANSLYNDFIDLDDPLEVIQNPYLRDISLKGISQVLIPHRPDLYGYYPVVHLSDMACFSIFRQFNPFVFRLMSVMLHCLCVVACFFTASIIGKKENIGFWTAFILAVHPSHTEVVNWISANRHLFAALFGFLTIYFYVLHKDRGKTSFYIVSVIMFILANLSKVSALALPFLLLLYEFISDKKFNLRKPYLASFFLIAAIFLFINFFIIPQKTSYVFIWKLFGWTALYKFPAFFMQYLGNALLPLRKDLAGICYLPGNFGSFYLSMLILSVIFIAGCYYLKVKNEKFALFGVITFIILLIPGIIKIEVPTPFSSRLLYFPSFGLYMAACILGEKAYNQIFKGSNLSRLVSIILCVLILISLGATTIHKNTNWLSARALWSNLLTDYPGRMLGLWRLHMLEKDDKKKIDLIEEIIRISEPSKYGYPDFYRRMKFISHSSLPSLYIAINADKEKIRSIFYDWYNFETQNPYPLWRLGSYYENKGLLKEAQLEYEKAVKIYGKRYDFWVSLARIYEKQGLGNKANNVYQEIYKRFPGSDIVKEKEVLKNDTK